MSEDFGSYLKHERELRGVPLDDIAESTKISVRFLRALEEGRFEDLPGEVFIKGFIRSYGQAIGSNVDELLAAYHESSSKGQYTESSDEIVPSKEEPPARPFVFPMKAVLGFVAALLIIGGGAYWITAEKGENTGTSQETRVAGPSTIDNSLPEVEGESPAPEDEIAPPLETESPVPEPERAEATGSSKTSNQEKPKKAPSGVTGVQSPVKNTFTVPENIDIIKDIQDQTVPGLIEPSTTDITEAASGESPLKLVIKVDENSWFNLRVDDQRDQDFILPPGGSKTIQAKIGVVMTIGNRRATQVTLNGQPLDLPESPDNVIRNLTVNAEQLN